jgi:hypothetical protein
MRGFKQEIWYWIATIEQIKNYLYTNAIPLKTD